MINHLMLGTNDLEASVRFYNALLGALGAQPGTPDRHRYFWRHAGSTFCVTTPINGQPATVANGFTLGLAAQSEEQVMQAYEVGLVQGGAPIEDPPGWRGGEHPTMFLAYLKDPTGHKLCLVYRPTKTN